VYFFAVHEPSGQDYPEQKHLFYSMNWTVPGTTVSISRNIMTFIHSISLNIWHALCGLYKTVWSFYINLYISFTVTRAVHTVRSVCCTALWCVAAADWKGNVCNRRERLRHCVVLQSSSLGFCQEVDYIIFLSRATDAVKRRAHISLCCVG
jgi:hypothetical protein